MSDFDPTRTRPGPTATHPGEADDAPPPTRFGREKRRRRPQREPATGAEADGPEPRGDADDPGPFEDHGGL